MLILNFVALYITDMVISPKADVEQTAWLHLSNIPPYELITIVRDNGLSGSSFLSKHTLEFFGQ